MTIKQYTKYVLREQRGDGREVAQVRAWQTAVRRRPFLVRSSFESDLAATSLRSGADGRPIKRQRWQL